jgi:hypothetical protein
VSCSKRNLGPGRMILLGVAILIVLLIVLTLVGTHTLVPD